MNPIRPLVPDHCLRTKLGDDLAAGATGRTCGIVIVDYGNGAYTNVASAQLGHGGENCGTLGAVGEPIGCVFDIASGKDLSILQKHGSPDPEVGVRRIGILLCFASELEKMLFLIGREHG